MMNMLFVAGLLPLPPGMLPRRTAGDPQLQLPTPARRSSRRPRLWITSTAVADPSPAWMVEPLAADTVSGPITTRDAVATRRGGAGAAERLAALPGP
jgi:hypothetical protein